MESTSPVTLPVYRSPASPAQSPTAGDKVEVQTLREAPEKTRKLFPDSQATAHRHQSRAITSMKISLFSNTGVSTSQERKSDGLLSKLYPPRPKTSNPEGSKQESPRPEQSPESPKVEGFKNKLSFFEENSTQKTGKTPSLSREQKPGRLPVTKYKSGEISKENQWVTHPYRDSDPSVAGWSLRGNQVTAKKPVVNFTEMSSQASKINKNGSENAFFSQKDKQLHDRDEHAKPCPITTSSGKTSPPSQQSVGNPKKAPSVSHSSSIHTKRPPRNLEAAPATNYTSILAQRTLKFKKLEEEVESAIDNLNKELDQRFSA